MIDLHCHILPGLDDGPAEIEGSLAMAAAAVEAGTTTVVATPHVREDYPFSLELIETRVHELRGALSTQDIRLEIAAGGEVAVTKAAEMDERELRTVCLGEGPYILVESPYVHATELLETTLFELQVHQLRPVLAHPERCPSFLEDPARLEDLVNEHGILSSVTSASIAGHFGSTVQKMALRLLHDGLVHNVASDAHDASQRPPDVSEGFAAVVGRFACGRDYQRWLTIEVPAAVVAGEALPPTPAPKPRRRNLRSLLSRYRGP